jgi:hypothetical protein
MAKTKKSGPRSSKRRWSGAVNRQSDALDLEKSIFKAGSPIRIAQSLKRSAERSTRRKGSPYQSAMSMLNFYINRAGVNLSERRKTVLERAKDALRKSFHRNA